VSIPTNIAEGFGRSSDKNLANFVRIARGSLAELETLVELSVRLGFLSEEQARPVTSLFGAIGRKTFMFLKSIDPYTVRESGVEYGTSPNSDSEASDSNAIDRN
jgi:four helix bundle protein